MMEDLLRASLSSDTDTAPGAPSTLKSRIFSALVRLEQEDGPLRILSESRDAGEQLCVFEHLVAAVPSEKAQAANPCEVCHARLLGEHVENAPIYWPGCPYSRYCGH
ncbi:hypothetical protein F183_A15350 [Bryobacterales bacterium F-183]|nr:hypothetical protein F183_A15350 [Bryobacterales bacterium F-183]